jgi:hypothetical protein
MYLDLMISINVVKRINTCQSFVDVNLGMRMCNFVFTVQCSCGALSILPSMKRCSHSVVPRSRGSADFELPDRCVLCLYSC